MKKYSFLLILFTILLFSYCTDQTLTNPNDLKNSTQVIPTNSKTVTGDNFILNSEMENGKEYYWSGGNSNYDYTFSHTDEEAYSGSHSLKLTSSAEKSDVFAYWGQTIDATNLRGNKLRVSALIKYNNVGNDGIAIAIRGDDTNSPQGSAEIFSSTQNKIIKTGTGDWETLEITLDKVTDDIQSITIYMLLNGGSGTVYFDDLTLTTETPSAPLYSLQNLDFEEGSSYPEFWWSGATKRNSFDISLVNDVALSLNQSVLIKSDASSNEFAYWAQTIEANQLIGKKLSFNVNIKGIDITGEGIAIAIRGDDNSSSSNSAEIFYTTQGRMTIDGTFDWKSFNVESEIIPNNIDVITVYLIYLRNTTGTVYFDDVSLN